MWPGAFVTMLLVWLCSNTFLLSFYTLRGRLHHIWVVPRWGFHVIFRCPHFLLCNCHWNPCVAWQSQYFLPFATQGINDQIEQAILRADRLGVKVLSLAALNKVWWVFQIPKHSNSMNVWLWLVKTMDNLFAEWSTEWRREIVCGQAPQSQSQSSPRQHFDRSSHPPWDSQRCYRGLLNRRNIKAWSSNYIVLVQKKDTSVGECRTHQT